MKSQQVKELAGAGEKSETTNFEKGLSQDKQAQQNFPKLADPKNVQSVIDLSENIKTNLNQKDQQQQRSNEPKSNLSSDKSQSLSGLNDLQLQSNSPQMKKQSAETQEAKSNSLKNKSLGSSSLKYSTPSKHPNKKIRGDDELSSGGKSRNQKRKEKMFKKQQHLSEQYTKDQPKQGNLNELNLDIKGDANKQQYQRDLEEKKKERSSLGYLNLELEGKNTQPELSGINEEMIRHDIQDSLKDAIQQEISKESGAKSQQKQEGQAHIQRQHLLKEKEIDQMLQSSDINLGKQQLQKDLQKQDSQVQKLNQEQDFNKEQYFDLKGKVSDEALKNYEQEQEDQAEQINTEEIPDMEEELERKKQQEQESPAFTEEKSSFFDKTEEKQQQKAQRNEDFQQQKQAQFSENKGKKFQEQQKKGQGAFKKGKDQFEEEKLSANQPIAQHTGTFLTHDLKKKIRQNLKRLRHQYNCIDEYCKKMKQGQKLMKLISIGILQRIHKIEYQLNLEQKKDDLMNDKLIRLMEKGMQDEMIVEKIHEQYKEKIEGEDLDKAKKEVQSKDIEVNLFNKPKKLSSDQQ
eukprot:403364242